MDLNKVFWFDLETTGLNDYKHGIIQLAGMFERDGEIIEEFEFEIEPDDSLEITQKALEINNYTQRELRSHMDETKAFAKIFEYFEDFVNRYDKDDKAFIGGYNVEFDIGFLSKFWKRNAVDSYLNAYISKPMSLDPFNLLPDKIYNGIVEEPPSMKLGDVCNFYMPDKSYEWHDAKADIEASRDLYNYLTNL